MPQKETLTDLHL